MNLTRPKWNYNKSSLQTSTQYSIEIFKLSAITWFTRILDCLYSLYTIYQTLYNHEKTTHWWSRNIVSKMYIRTNSGDAQLLIAYKCLIKHFHFSGNKHNVCSLSSIEQENLIHKSLCMNRKDKSSLSGCNIKHKSRKCSHA